MEQEHEKNLRVILRKTDKDFKEWVESLTEEELTYVEWLLEKTDETLDEMLIKQSNLKEAISVIKKIMTK